MDQPQTRATATAVGNYLVVRMDARTGQARVESDASGHREAKLSTRAAMEAEQAKSGARLMSTTA